MTPTPGAPSDQTTMSAGRKVPYSKAALSAMVDHTKLTFALGEEEASAIELLCQQAQQHGFAAVCVQPRHVAMAKQLLRDTPQIQVATVIGFPQKKVERDAEILHPTIGNVPTEVKCQEIRQALVDGATELDVVLNVGLFQADLQQDNMARTEAELQAIRQTAGTTMVKLIIETDLLHQQEVKMATQLAIVARCDMVKTCTGMVNQGRGATPALVRLIQDTIDSSAASSPHQVKPAIKASGGIRTLDQVALLLEAGATRIGTSAGIGVVASL